MVLALPRRLACLLFLLFGAWNLDASWAADPAGGIEARLTEARQHYERGAVASAIELWSDAVARCRLAGQEITGGSPLARALLGRAAAYRASGRPGPAIADLESLLAAADGLTDASARAAIQGSLGQAYAQTGQQERALETLDQAIAATEGRPALLARLLNDRGNLQLARDNPDAAADDYFTSFTLAGAQVDDPTLRVGAGINLARLALRDDRLELAETTLDALLPALRRLSPDTRTGAQDSLAAGKRFLELHALLPGEEVGRQKRALENAYDALGLARAAIERSGDRRAGSYLLAYLGQLYQAGGRPAEALDLTRQAIQQAQQIAAPELLYQWEWQLARLQRAAGAEMEALASYRNALVSLEVVRQDMTLDRGRGITFREEVGNLFLEFADLLMTHAAEEGEATAQALLLEARQTVEGLKAAEITDYFQDDCVTAARAKRRDLDRLDARTAVLYPLLLPERTEVLVTLPNGLARVTLAVSGPVLAEGAALLRLLLEERDSDAFLPQSRKLYDHLIAPLEPLLEANRVETLVLVPDGPLRSIPLSALHDGKGYLIERYGLAVTPGLELTDPRPLATADAQVLLAGLTQAVSGFAALPNVGEELGTVRQRLDGQLLLDEAFTQEAVTEELAARPYDVLHIASHAYFDRRARGSFLLTYDGRLSMDQLEEVVKISQFRDDPIELLVLSACQTAVGDDRAALGLAGVGLKAGARSVLASLWSVSDRATLILMTHFYRYLEEEGVNKAEALRRAKLQLLEDDRFAHPGFWSPFLMIGNWL